MKSAFVVIDRNIGTVTLYDVTEVTIEALLEKFDEDDVYVEHLPIRTEV